MVLSKDDAGKTVKNNIVLCIIMYVHIMHTRQVDDSDART